MKKVSFLVLLALGFSPILADTYTHYDWTCLTKNNSPVSVNESVNNAQNYGSAKYYSNGGNGLPSNCVGKQTKQNYTMTIDNNGGSGGSLKYNSDGSMYISNPSRDTYDFTGWSTSNGNAPANNIPSTFAGNVTYTANWSYRPIVDLNPVINGTQQYNGLSGFLCDIYVDGNLVASQVQDWYQRVPYNAYVKIVPVTNTSNYNVTTWEGRVTSDTSANPTWTIKTIYGYQNATGYSGSYQWSAPSYYRTGTVNYWSNYNYKTSSYSCNCHTVCTGPRVAGNPTCPGDNCDWRENAGGCWWHRDTGNSCDTCWNSTNANCGWTTAGSIEAAGCATGYGLNNRGTHQTATVYYPVTSWGSVQNCGTSQCASKSATRRLVKSNDNGATWNEY